MLLCIAVVPACMMELICNQPQYTYAHGMSKSDIMWKYWLSYSGWVLQRCLNFSPPQEDISTTSSPQDALKHRQLLTSNHTSHKPLQCEWEHLWFCVRVLSKINFPFIHSRELCLWMHCLCLLRIGIDINCYSIGLLCFISFWLSGIINSSILFSLQEL